MISGDGSIAQTSKIDITSVIPCYNAERYLIDCVESLHLESHPEIDVILVDDGSTDGTSSICDDLAASHESLMVIHRENGGSSSARNAGLSCADGNWVWFVDSDDAVSPYAFDVLLPVCRRSQADAIQFDLLRFEDGECVEWPEPGKTDCETMNSANFAAALHSCSRQHFVGSFLFRNKDQWHKKDQMQRLFFEEYSLFEDAVSIEQFVISAEEIEAVDAAIYGYRQVGSSITHKRSDASADSGLRAVRAISGMPVDWDDATSRKRMELSLLFTAYRVALKHSPLKREIKKEIEARAKTIGIMRLGRARMVRYFLLECGAMDLIIDWRERAC